MTIDKLLDISSEAWDNLSDADLHKILSPYFNVTRPPPSVLAQAEADKLTKKSGSGGSSKTKVSIASQQQLLDLAKSLGINIPTSTKPT